MNFVKSLNSIMNELKNKKTKSIKNYKKQLEIQCISMNLPGSNGKMNKSKTKGETLNYNQKI